jgi:TRAP-type C4-dicarboxylate transport system permease small subunit
MGVRACHFDGYARTLPRENIDMALLKNFSKACSKITEFICLLLGCGLFTLLGIQVIGRYGFHWSPVWAAEGAQVLFVWFCFLGFARAARHGEHVSLGYLHASLPSSIRFTAQFVAILSTIFVGVVLSVGGLLLAERLASATTSGIGISVSYLYAAPFVSGALIILFEVDRLFDCRKNSQRVKS